MPDADVMDRPATGDTVPEKVTKSQFAEMCRVTPGRVSQWIAEGKIAASSLDGEGRAAKVIVRSAVADLCAKLDVSQSVGLNGLASRLAISRMAADTPPRTESPNGGPAQSDDTTGPDASRPEKRVDETSEAIARQRLRQQELTTARLEREEAVAAGRYVLAEDARAQIGRTASTVLTAVEAGFASMADDLCARFPDLPRRDVIHALTTSFRKVREKAAKGFAERRDSATAQRGEDAAADE